MSGTDGDEAQLAYGWVLAERKRKSIPVCECWHNPETGLFEPCCQQHEWDYVDYLEKQRSKELGINEADI